VGRQVVCCNLVLAARTTSCSRRRSSPDVKPLHLSTSTYTMLCWRCITLVQSRKAGIHSQPDACCASVAPTTASVAPDMMQWGPAKSSCQGTTNTHSASVAEVRSSDLIPATCTHTGCCSSFHRLQQHPTIAHTARGFANTNCTCTHNGCCSLPMVPSFLSQQLYCTCSICCPTQQPPVARSQALKQATCPPPPAGLRAVLPAQPASTK